MIVIFLIANELYVCILSLFLLFNAVYKQLFLENNKEINKVIIKVIKNAKRNEKIE